MIPFYKFHGAGNDFILIDNRLENTFSTSQIAFYANRRLGIGADGVILLEAGNSECDFGIRYFNADGLESSLCGNGSRCAVAFANHLKIIGLTCCFRACDGLHHAQILAVADQLYKITITMNDVSDIEIFDDGYFTDTGSPHFVTFIEKIEECDILNCGIYLRNDPRFPQGTNVNFIEKYNDGIFVRTFERGVEDETLSCGTGVTAAALIYTLKFHFTDNQHNVPVYTRGGIFTVSFTKKGRKFSNIRLTGPVKFVFQGEIESLIQVSCS